MKEITIFMNNFNSFMRKHQYFYEYFYFMNTDYFMNKISIFMKKLSISMKKNMITFTFVDILISQKHFVEALDVLNTLEKEGN